MIDRLKPKIRSAFQHVKYLGDWCLVGSMEGEEPELLEKDFFGKTDWSALEPAFLDQAPGGYGSALHFFSDEAHRFYLPAYLLADLDGTLDRVDVVFHLCHPFTNAKRDEQVNPQRYGVRIWFEEGTYRFAVFDADQVEVIIEYLEHKRMVADTELERHEIEQSLANYWTLRLKALRDRPIWRSS